MKLKQLFLSLLFMAAGASAQSIDVNTNDTATGTRLILTKNHKGTALDVDDTVTKTGLVFFSAGYQSTNVKNNKVETYFIDLDMFHNNNKLGCIRQSDNNMLLILEDGTEIQCFQMSETECSHEAYKASFALTTKKGSAEEMEKNFKKLQTIAIAKIEIKTTEGALVYKVKAKDYLKAHFALIDKTLNGSVK